MNEPTETTVSEEALEVSRFDKLIQLSVDEAMPSMQRSSSPIKSERRINPSQTTGTELKKRLIIVYGVLQSKTKSAADSVRLDQATLDSYFECVPALQVLSCRDSCFKSTREATHNKNYTRQYKIKIA